MRGLAVMAVLAFHGGMSWARGGFLGVDAFFVLSGYLITSLLLAEWEQTGRIALGMFWARRARRLLPALLLMVAVVTLGARTLLPPEEVRLLRGDGLAALFYVANWRMILLREVAADHPDVRVLDFGARVSPEGHFTWTAGGIKVRSDGVHLTPSGVQDWIAPWLLPQLRTAVTTEQVS